MNLISVISSDGVFYDGEYILPLTFCKCNYNKGKCLDFYNSIKTKEKNRFYTCPYGMSIYVTDSKIYTCMRERTTYQKDLSKKISNENVFNPLMDAPKFLTLISATKSIEEDEKKINEKQAAVDSISHEVKQLNAQIKDRSNIILQSYKFDEENITFTDSDIEFLHDEIRTIFVSSSMVASRFSLYDYEKNPHALKQGTPRASNVYKKFDKIRKIFKNYMHKATTISINSGSYLHILAYPSFEMIPLLLIENAVKYSYGHNDEVSIDFREEDDNKLIVTISSYSPYCSKEESTQIFEKGFRGKNAKKISDGSGIGLYFVKMLCDLHNIEISAESDSNRIAEISGVAYAPFKYTLIFNNTFHV